MSVQSLLGILEKLEETHTMVEELIHQNEQLREDNASLLVKVGELKVFAGNERGGSMHIQHALDFCEERNPNALRKTDVRIALGVLAGAVERYRMIADRICITCGEKLGDLHTEGCGHEGYVGHPQSSQVPRF